MPATDSPLDIQVTWRLRKSWHAARLLRRVAAHVAAAEGFRTGRLSVVVVGGRAMTTLHERYLGVAEPTDVLAFDLGTDRRKARLDGEVILCADLARCRTRSRLRLRAARSALAGRVWAAARAELALYLTHGILHLAGYDDHSSAGFHRMHAREDLLLCELGLGPVFRGERF